MINKPEYGKQYALTGATGTKCIANGNTWAESLVQPTRYDIMKKISLEYLVIVRDLHTDWLRTYGADRNGWSDVSFGKRYAKVFSGEWQGQQYAEIVKDKTIHTFIDLTNGDILKAATWNAPAKNGVRGNIYAADCGRSVINWHGAKYINGGMKQKMVELKK